MKIVPSLPIAPASWPAATPSSPSASGVPFEKLLAGGDGEPPMELPVQAPPGPPLDLADEGANSGVEAVIDLAQVQQHRALGFSEASLLGQGQGPFATAPTEDPAADLSSVPTASSGAAAAVAAGWAQPNLPSPAQSPTPAIAVAGASPVAGASRTATAVPTPAAQGPTLGQTSAHALIVRTISGALRDAQAHDPATPDRDPLSARFDPSRPPKPAAKTQVTVAVTEADGALQVIAASPGLNPEAAVRVRRIVSDLVERFGLRLSDLHLNGVRVAPSSTGPTGAAHGG